MRGLGFESRSKLPLTRLAVAALRRATLSRKGRGFPSEPRARRLPPHREHRPARERVWALSRDYEPVLLVEANGAGVVLLDVQLALLQAEAFGLGQQRLGKYFTRRLRRNPNI